LKVALITGAGTGIGRATALEFLAAGVAVVALGRRAGPLESLAADSGKADLVATIAADATADDTPARAVALALQRFGRLDYLVNNAGVGRPKPVHETDDAFLDANLNLMLRAPFRFIREAVPVMGPESCIVNVSSTYGLVGGLRGGAYSAAKAGLIGLTTHVACQYGSIGIRCNAVAPGAIETEMTSDRMSSETFRRMNEEMTPAARWGTTQDVAGMIVFLCSDKAGWINGQCIAIDGGWTATKFLSERALAARRELVQPKFTHSGRPAPQPAG
jgi:NAD(P)-dependent dehydrogenase (short-subunit alcohol dehydrogenase family)